MQHQKPKLTGPRFKQMMFGAYASHLLYAAACDLKLFTYLSRQPRSTLAEIASGLVIPLHSARVLLASCCSLDLITVDAERKYTNSAIADRFLTDSGDQTFMDILRCDHEMTWPSLFHIGASLREGKNVGITELPGSSPTLYDRLNENPDLQNIYFKSMSAVSRAMSMHLGFFSPEVARVRHLADMGCGDGENSLNIMREHPEVRVTLCDSRERCELARKKLADNGFAERVQTLPCNFLVDPYPSDVDGFMFCHSLGGITSDEVQGVFKKAHGLLPPGGVLLYYDYGYNDEETGPPEATFLSLYLMALATGKGMSWPAKDVAEWLRGTGFKDIRSQHVPSNGHIFVAATK